MGFGRDAGSRAGIGPDLTASRIASPSRSPDMRSRSRRRRTALPAQLAERGRDGLGRGHRVTGAAQTDREELAHRALVVDDQDLPHGKDYGTMQACASVRPGSCSIELCTACGGGALGLRLAFDRGGLVGLVALVAYGVLASPFIVDGDNAEFSTLAHTGGLAHPSGYPRTCCGCAR